MADDGPELDRPADNGRPKRPPPTLDLSATEVPRDDGLAADANASVGPEPTRPRGGAILTAALSGAAGALLMIAVAWVAMRNWMPAASAPQPPVQVEAGRIDDISARLAKVEARPSQPSPAAAPDLSPLHARLEAVEKAVAAGRDETAASREQAAQALSAANEAKSAAASQPVAGAPLSGPSVDLSPINGRLTELEAAIRIQAERNAQGRPPADDRAARRLAAASLLDAQVRSGEPYTAALSAAKALAADVSLLAPLDPFAASGLPSDAAMTRELQAVAPFIAQPAPADAKAASGWLERLRGRAANLVSIERTDAPAGLSPASSRALAAARRGDLAEASRELAALPENERGIYRPWLERVAARDAARQAARQFADAALSVVAKP